MHSHMAPRTSAIAHRTIGTTTAKHAQRTYHEAGTPPARRSHNQQQRSAARHRGKTTRSRVHATPRRARVGASARQTTAALGERQQTGSSKPTSTAGATYDWLHQFAHVPQAHTAVCRHGHERVRVRGTYDSHAVHRVRVSGGRQRRLLHGAVLCPVVPQHHLQGTGQGPREEMHTHTHPCVCVPDTTSIATTRTC